MGKKSTLSIEQRAQLVLRKTEEVYRKLCASPAEARELLEVFHRRYNKVRPHRALVPIEGGDPVKPQDVYVHGHAVQLPKWQGWGARAAGKKLHDMIDGAHLPVVALDATTWAT